MAEAVTRLAVSLLLVAAAVSVFAAAPQQQARLRRQDQQDFGDGDHGFMGDFFARFPQSPFSNSRNGDFHQADGDDGGFGGHFGHGDGEKSHQTHRRPQHPHQPPPEELPAEGVGVGPPSAFSPLDIESLLGSREAGFGSPPSFPSSQDIIANGGGFPNLGPINEAAPDLLTPQFGFGGGNFGGAGFGDGDVGGGGGGTGVNTANLKDTIYRDDFANRTPSLAGQPADARTSHGSLALPEDRTNEEGSSLDTLSPPSLEQFDVKSSEGADPAPPLHVQVGMLTPPVPVFPDVDLPTLNRVRNLHSGPAANKRRFRRKNAHAGGGLPNILDAVRLKAMGALMMQQPKRRAGQQQRRRTMALGQTQPQEGQKRSLQRPSYSQAPVPSSNRRNLSLRRELWKEIKKQKEMRGVQWVPVSRKKANAIVGSHNRRNSFAGSNRRSAAVVPAVPASGEDNFASDVVLAPGNDRAKKDRMSRLQQPQRQGPESKPPPSRMRRRRRRKRPLQFKLKLR